MDMTYVRAIVDQAEKLRVKARAKELGLNESEIVRQGLRKMGVDIEVDKGVGISTSENPGKAYGRGGKAVAEHIEKNRDAIIADYAAGMSWAELKEKYDLAMTTISRIIPVEMRRRKK